MGGIGGECHTFGAQAGPGGSSHCPAPKASLLLLQPEPSMPNTALLIKNPLAATHEFKQACQLCYPKTGKATPPWSTPLPRDGRGLRSIASQNDRSPVHLSEISLGRQKPCCLFRAAGDVGGAGTFKTARKAGGVEAGRHHRACRLLLHKLRPRSGVRCSHRAQGAAGQYHGYPTAQRLVPGGGRQGLASCHKHIC